MCAVVMCACAGCNVRQIAVRNLSDALASGADVYASDDDPDLVRQALPFALKLNESLLAENPRHRGLLLSACRGFTGYSYLFLEQDADRTESVDLAAATAMRHRACRLYLRARNYGLQALDAAHEGFRQQLYADPRSAVARAVRADVSLLYWTAASWGSAISLSKDQPERIAEQPIVESLIDRALQLDEGFDAGAIHSFLITYEMARKGDASDPVARARQHYERALELSERQSAVPMVAFAESVCIARQDRRQFEEVLHHAIAIDVDARPQTRLMNVVMQRRAQWLLSRADDLFVQ
jgi:predicted anti-sigma-YlaC factor YlaD